MITDICTIEVSRLYHCCHNIRIKNAAQSHIDGGCCNSSLAVIRLAHSTGNAGHQRSGRDGPRLGHFAGVVALTGDGHGVGASILTRSLAANGIVTRR